MSDFGQRGMKSDRLAVHPICLENADKNLNGYINIVTQNTVVRDG